MPNKREPPASRCIRGAVGEVNCPCKACRETAKKKVAAVVESEPSAWRVLCPGGHEFLYLIRAQKEDAYDEAMEFVQQEIVQMNHDPTPEEEAEIEEKYKPVPLYALLSRPPVSP